MNEIPINIITLIEKRYCITFYLTDHQNYFGIDENFGPVAISIRREKLEDRENKLGKAEYGHYQHRMIFRTSEVIITVFPLYCLYQHRVIFRIDVLRNSQ